MSRLQIKSAIGNGLPFTIHMADGKDYHVPHPDHISLPPKAAYAIVYGDEGQFNVLPMLTMTGLTSKTTSTTA